MAQPNINQKSSQEGKASKETKSTIDPKPQIERLRPLSERNSRISDLSWGIRSRKNKIYEKYGISGKEVDEFTNNLEKYDKSRGGSLGRHESTELEKELSRGDEKSKKWLKILRDPKILNE